MHQRGADHRAVDHPPGDDDIRPQLKRADNARRAEVGIGGHAQRRQRRAVEHVDAAAQVFELGLQVIAQQHGDFQRQLRRVAGRLQGGGAGLGVDAPALLITRMPWRWISASSGDSTSTKSVA